MLIWFLTIILTWGSTVSSLQSHNEETVDSLPLSSKEILELIEVCFDKFDTYWYVFLLSEVSSETVFLKKVFNSSQMFLLVCSNSFLSTSFCLFVSFCYSRKKVWTFLQKILLYFTKERFKPLEKVFPFFLIRASTSFFCFL